MNKVCLIFTVFFTFLFFVESGFAQTVTVISQKANLRGTPSQSGKVVIEVQQNESFEMIKQSGSWFLVQTPEYVGWLHGNTIKIEGIIGVSEEVYSPPPTPKARSTKSKNSTSTTSSDRTYIRGPRGGCYYINSNGNKTYVDKEKCRN